MTKTAEDVLLAAEIRDLENIARKGREAEAKLADKQQLAGELRAKRIGIKAEGGGGYESRPGDGDEWITIDGVRMPYEFNGVGQWRDKRGLSKADTSAVSHIVRFLRLALFDDLIEIKVKDKP